MNEEIDFEKPFYAIGPDGTEREYETLFTCESDDGTKHYIVYTDHSVDEAGNVRVFASIYNPDAENMELTPITDEKEWKIIETVIAEIQAEANKENEQ